MADPLLESMQKLAAAYGERLKVPMSHSDACELARDTIVLLWHVEHNYTTINEIKALMSRSVESQIERMDAARRFLETW